METLKFPVSLRSLDVSGQSLGTERLSSAPSGTDATTTGFAETLDAEMASRATGEFGSASDERYANGPANEGAPPARSSQGPEAPRNDASAGSPAAMIRSAPGTPEPEMGADGAASSMSQQVPAEGLSTTADSNGDSMDPGASALQAVPEPGDADREVGGPDHDRVPLAAAASMMGAESTSSDADPAQSARAGEFARIQSLMDSRSTLGIASPDTVLRTQGLQTPAGLSAARATGSAGTDRLPDATNPQSAGSPVLPSASPSAMATIGDPAHPPAPTAVAPGEQAPSAPQMGSGSESGRSGPAPSSPLHPTDPDGPLVASSGHQMTMDHSMDQGREGSPDLQAPQGLPMQMHGKDMLEGVQATSDGSALTGDPAGSALEGVVGGAQVPSMSPSEDTVGSVGSQTTPVSASASEVHGNGSSETGAIEGLDSVLAEGETPDQMVTTSAEPTRSAGPHDASSTAGVPASPGTGPSDLAASSHPASGAHTTEPSDGTRAGGGSEVQAGETPAFDATPVASLAESPGEPQAGSQWEARLGADGADIARQGAAAEIGPGAVARGERSSAPGSSDAPFPWSSETGEAAGASAGRPGAEALARAERILQQVRLHIRPHMNQASLQLNPASLGRVDIHMEVEDGELTAVIRAERPEALSVLERHLPELRSMFQQSGVEVADLDLGLGFQGEEAPADSESQGEARSRATQATQETERPLESAVAARISDLGVDTYA